MNTCKIRIGTKKRARLLLVYLKNVKKSEIFRNFRTLERETLNLEIESPIFPEFVSENEKY